ncbi:MAG: glycoside hydrolase family protein [Rikenellaceae bacterium]
MKRFATLFLLLIAVSCTTTQPDTPRDIKLTLGATPYSSVFTDGDSGEWTVWGASMIKGEDNLYHIFYSRWKKSLGWSWTTDSEIAHAVSSSPYGPWEYKDVALPRRGREFWDGWCTHNPTIHSFDGKYYLYYMGNTGNGENYCTPQQAALNWEHRNGQRIGVAVAESLDGPWRRFDTPLIDASEDPEAPDALLTSNPSICRHPNGEYLMIYKSVAKKNAAPGYGPVSLMAATSMSPTGPFVKSPRQPFDFQGEQFPAEDPYIWYQDGRYRAIVKRVSSGEARNHSLMLYESDNGLDWREAKESHLSDIEVLWEDGKLQKLDHLDRPQLYVEDGKPKVILFAADTLGSDGVVNSWNMQMPIESIFVDGDTTL